MSINQLILELKENNEDFEFYPTSKEMIEVIAPYLDHESVLDIGCGTCNFQKFINEIYKKRCKEYEQKFKMWEDLGGYHSQQNKPKEPEKPINKYYVMEKSKILLQKLDKDIICLGTDFNTNTLIDKKVSTIFCNPPYSEFTNWLQRIISEGNYIQAFLVIPQRWKENQETMNLLEFYKTSYDILGSFDFLEAERKARAKVDVVRFYKKRYYSCFESRYYRKDNQKDFDQDAFDGFFAKTFNIETKKIESDYEREDRINKQKQDKITGALATQEGSKAQILVNLYNEEYNTLINHLNLIMQLDENVLETFGFSVEKVKEGLKSQITGMKYRYWRRVLDEMNEITDRLTHESRESLMRDFQELQCLDFTIENIYSLILWVIKNANKYYENQLISFFKKLSDEKNVKPYKSNQRLFEKDGYYWNSEKKTNYVLDYRIIMSYMFRMGWSGQLETNMETERTLQDIRTIANNLGFETLDYGWTDYPTLWGEKKYIYNKVGEKPFMEYKVYQNRNMHVKFNQEFTKALNVEVSRLLGWIRTKEDIKNEFPDQLAKGAEKYFKVNKYISLENSGIKLLGTLQ